MEQTFFLSFLIQAVAGLEGLVAFINGDAGGLAWYIPLSFMLGSLLCSIPTLLFLTDKNLSKAEWRIRKVLHCLIVYAIVMGMGYLFHWYRNLTYFLVTTIAYFVIYTAVWMFTMFLERYDEHVINEALSRIRDED